MFTGGTGTIVPSRNLPLPFTVPTLRDVVLVIPVREKSGGVIVGLILSTP